MTCNDIAESTALKKRDGRQGNGPVDQGLKEAKKLITGPKELFDAVSARAAELAIKPAEAWRRAAREWLASVDP